MIIAEVKKSVNNIINNEIMRDDVVVASDAPLRYLFKLLTHYLFSPFHLGLRESLGNSQHNPTQLVETAWNQHVLIMNKNLSLSAQEQSKERMSAVELSSKDSIFNSLFLRLLWTLVTVSHPSLTSALQKCSRLISVYAGKSWGTSFFRYLVFNCLLQYDCLRAPPKNISYLGCLTN